MRYFAYGSNLNRDDLERWCRERGLPSTELGAGTRAFLPDRRLAFTHRSSTRGGGVLDVRPSTGCAVAGIVFEVRDDAVAVLDRKEAEGHVYRRIETTALSVDGREHGVFTYEVDPSRREPFVVPADSYLDVVRRGYGAFSVETDPLDAAARGAAHPGPVARLFVYGTLMRGEERHPALLRHGARFECPGRARGTLHDLGPYPALSADPADDPVVGELYEAPDLGALLTETDRVEGFGGFGARGSLYRRAIVRVTSDLGGSVLAWTYLLAGDAGGARVIASGDWRRRQDVP
jgi:gamma-glutamylcyclotransferase (GGCT)/AIG2-like uncharacterized protein YtfP